MGYDPHTVYREVSRLLSLQPGRGLSAVAKELRVGRHTVTRDIKRVSGLSFRQLQATFMRTAIDRLLAEGPLLKKELANRLGLNSSRALRSWWSRLEPGLKNAQSAPGSSQMRHRSFPTKE